MADQFNSPGAPTPLPNRFRLEGLLGEGGLGTVVKAYDTQLHTYVAIKTIRNDLAVLDPQQYASLRERFRREAIAGARVRSCPYVVTVYDQTADNEGNAFLILEFVPGGTLRDRVKRGRIPLTEALRLLADMAQGLLALHEADIVHRDIKPENIFIAGNGRAQVADLGVAQMSDTTFSTRLGSSGDHGHPGTPLYMSPEQALTSGFLHPESDQYSLGAVFFEMLTAKRLRTVRATERERLFSEMPAPVAAMIRRMTADDPDARYPGMEALLDAITAIQRTVERKPQFPLDAPETVPAPLLEQRFLPTQPVSTPPGSAVGDRPMRYEPLPMQVGKIPPPVQAVNFPAALPPEASKTRNTYGPIAIVAVVVILLGSGGAFALFNKSNRNVLATNTPAISSPIVPTVAVGAQVPDFMVTSQGGKNLTKVELMGKSTLLFFFASWSPHCQTEAPRIRQIAQANPDLNVVMIGVGDRETQQDIWDFQGKFSLPFPAYADPATPLGKTASSFGITGYPTIFTVDKNGVVQARNQNLDGSVGGEVTSDQLQQMVTKAKG